jgi:hypothetical protein
MRKLRHRPKATSDWRAQAKTERVARPKATSNWQAEGEDRACCEVVL